MNGIETGVLISLALYFLLMIGIGVWAYFKADNDSAGYMLAFPVICTALVWSVFGLP